MRTHLKKRIEVVMVNDGQDVVIVNEKQMVNPIRYEIYLQDLNDRNINLKMLGYVNAQDEAISCCKMFKEALQATMHEVEYKNCTVFFRPAYV